MLDEFKFMLGSVITIMLASTVGLFGYSYFDSKSIDTVEAKQESIVNNNELTNDYLLVVDGGILLRTFVSKEIKKDSENPNVYNYIYGDPFHSDSVASENNEVNEQVTLDSSLEDHVTVTLAEDSESKESQETSSDVWVSYTATDDVDIYVLNDVTRSQYEEMKYEICDIVF